MSAAICGRVHAMTALAPRAVKLRLHFARLTAVRAVDLVSLRAPRFSVEVAVTNGLGYVLELDVLAAFKVGNGAGNL